MNKILLIAGFLLTGFGILKSQPVSYIMDLKDPGNKLALRTSLMEVRDGSIIYEYKGTNNIRFTKFDECLNIVWCKSVVESDPVNDKAIVTSSVTKIIFSGLLFKGSNWENIF